MRLFEDEIYWVQIKDGDDRARALYRRHYSCYEYKDGRQPKLFVGPGVKVVLIGKQNDALFVWRKFKSLGNEHGINCAVFRNESNLLSSDLILQAEIIIRKLYPKERLYTYVNSLKIKSTNPGCCFIKAGWKKCGITKKQKLIILEKNI